MRLFIYRFLLRIRPLSIERNPFTDKNQALRSYQSVYVSILAYMFIICREKFFDVCNAAASNVESGVMCPQIRLI